MIVIGIIKKIDVNHFILLKLHTLKMIVNFIVKCHLCDTYFIYIIYTIKTEYINIF